MAEEKHITIKRHVGHISGFAINQTDAPAPGPGGAAYNVLLVIEELKKLLKSSNVTRVNELFALLNEHIDEDADPHGTLTQDLVAKINEQFFPGTIPQTYPVYSFVHDQLDGIDATLYTHPGTAWVMDYDLKLKQFPANKKMVNYSDLNEGLPIFNAWSNLFIRSKTPDALAYLTNDGTARLYASSTLSLETTVDPSDISPKGVGTEDEVVKMVAGDNTTEQTFRIHGLGHTTAESTISFYLHPKSQYLRLKLKDDVNGDPVDHEAIIDFNANTFTSTGAFTDVRMETFANGYRRIFVMHGVNPSPTLGLECTPYDTESYLATSIGQDLGLLFGIQVQDGHAMSPYLETTGSSVAHPELTLTYDIEGIATPLSFFVSGSVYSGNTGSMVEYDSQALLTWNTDYLDILDGTSVIGPISEMGYNDINVFMSINASTSKSRMNTNNPVQEDHVLTFGNDSSLVFKNVNGYVKNVHVHREYDASDLATYFIGYLPVQPLV